MIKRLKNRIYYEIENIKFNIFSNILKKYDVEIFHKDRMGFFIKRKYDDNFKYIFETNNSCDAVPLMESLSKRINNSKIGIDVGANIGITTIWMSKNCEKVYAFEPEIENIERFNENMLANNIVNVELIQKAVSDSQGEMKLNVLESYGHHSLGKVSTSKQVGIQAVSVVTLDMFCTSTNIDEIDFLKVDVEGFEMEVFKGAINLFENKKNKVSSI